MSLPPAGWFPDPQHPNQHRFWDGTRWTAHVAPPASSAARGPHAGVPLAPPRPPIPAAPRRKRPVWLWILLAAVLLPLCVLLAPLAAVIALLVLTTGIVALTKDTPTWLRLRSRTSAAIATALAAVTFLAAGSLTSLIYPRHTEIAAVTAPPAIVATVAPAPSATPAASATPSQDDEADAIAFAGQAVAVADASVTADQTALGVLATLEVKGRAAKTGYDRAQFGQRWLDVDRNGCDTRNDVLARDLTDLVRSGPCKVLSGDLVDPYTASTIGFVRGQGTSELVQIDHVVSLSDAWQKGGQLLTADQRATFANDPLNLLAVSGDANQQKGDGDAATWLPRARGFRCEYVARQIAVKATYHLWVTQAESEAMQRVLSACPDEKAPTSAFAAPVPSPVVTAAPAPADPAPAAPAPAEQAPAPAEPAPAAPAAPYYANCTAARAAGVAPLRSWDPGYRTQLDRDRDGIACE